MHRLAIVLACGLAAGVGSTRVIAAEAETAERIAKARLAAAEDITAPQLKAHVEFLASDHLEGRATPSRGLDIAADYIVSHFARVGLEPGGENGTWFQSFALLNEARLISSELAIPAVPDGATGQAFKLGDDYMPLTMTGSGKVEAAPIVFAGYGITAPEESYDDYAAIDAKGKIVLVLRHEPRERDDGPAFAGRRFSKHAPFQAKIDNAAAHGAVALLLVTDPKNHPNRKPEGRWPVRYDGAEEEGEDGVPKPALPAFQVSYEAALALVGGRDLAKVQEEIDGDLKPRSFAVEGARVTVAAKVEIDRGFGRNVIGVLRGTDPTLAAEVVVIGAHYDHVGVQHEDGAGFPGQVGRPVDGDRIHNGADDNASGTAGLLEVAESFMRAAVKPRRTIVFIAFAGEELGLIGSRHYVRKPTVAPIEKTVAMVNLDMIGRNASDRLFIEGSLDGPFGRALAAANSAVDQKWERMRSGGSGGSSDHASFLRARVPSIFFFTGTHRDYHRVTDHADKIEIAKMEKVSRLAYLTTAIVADDPELTQARAAAQAAQPARPANPATPRPPSTPPATPPGTPAPARRLF